MADLSGCGNKMFFDHVQLNANNFLFENTTKNMCVDCTVDDINDNADKIFKSDHKCDWCNEEKPTVSWMHPIDMKGDILFGKQWWNGFHICQNCITENIIKHKDTQTSSIMKINKNGKMRPVNSLGLME